MLSRVLSLIIVLNLAIACSGQTFKKTFDKVSLSDGDSFVFLGDSITHASMYTQYVEDYYYTRYPNKRIQFHNAGVSGDHAYHCVDRFEKDIAAFKPKYVSILIGMNDGRYEAFDDKIVKAYQTNMTKVLDLIAGINATPIVMTPTMYDLRPALKGDNWVSKKKAAVIDYNATLSYFGMWGLKQANDRGAGFVNMFEPLNRITREQRKYKSNFTLIPDAVHPEGDGQLIMALAMLEDIGASSLVSNIVIDKVNNQWGYRAENGIISETSSDKIKFKFLAKSLPWVVPSDAQKGYQMSNAASMSQEILQVIGLSSGMYQLKISGANIAAFNHHQLAKGVQLQTYNSTPQYQQALTIAKINKEKNEEAVEKLRGLWLERKFRIEGPGEEDEEEAEELEGEEEEMDEEGEDEETDHEGDEEEEEEEEHLIDPTLPMDQYMTIFDQKVAEQLAAIKKYDEKIYQMNQPKPYVYELVPMN